MGVSNLCALISIIIVSCQGEDININLPVFNPNNEATHLFKQHVDLDNELNQIVIDNHNFVNLGYYIIQVHSYFHNVTLSNSTNFAMHSSVNGTNVGLVQMYHQRSQDNFYVRKYSNVNVKALVAVTLYSEDDPVPGGCNMIFNTEIAPSQEVSHTDSMILVRNQPPSIPKLSCNNNSIEVHMYHLFIPDATNQTAAYFKSVEKMLTVEDIKKFGRQVPDLEGFTYRRLYSRYKEVGEVFAVVARYGNVSSAYVPAVYHSIYTMNMHEQEAMFAPWIEILLTIELHIFGLLLIFFGHRLFRSTMLIIAYILGIMICFILFSLLTQRSLTDNLHMSFIIGLIFGVMWSFIWWQFGIPLLSVQITYIVAGTLIASLVFYSGLADVWQFHNNINFWITCACLIIAVTMISTMIIVPSHIFACSLIGSYLCVIGTNYYFGGNLEYIIVNLIRRATVPDFNLAIISPPYQTLDGLQTTFWVVLTLVGFTYQMKNQKRRPPFPPPRDSCFRRFRGNADERTPLLQ